MNHATHNIDFFLNYGELLLSSITETAIFQNAFSAKRPRSVDAVFSEIGHWPPATPDDLPPLKSLCRDCKSRPSAAEAALILVHFTARLKSCPDENPSATQTLTYYLLQCPPWRLQRFELWRQTYRYLSWVLFFGIIGSGVQDASRPRAGPSPPDAINKSKRF